MVCTKIVLVPVHVKNARQECSKKNKLLAQVQIIIVIFALSDSTRSKKNRPRAFHATQVVMDNWMEIKFQDVLTVLRTRLRVPRSRRRVKIVRAEGVQAQGHPLVHSVQLENTSMEMIASSARLESTSQTWSKKRVLFVIQGNISPNLDKPFVSLASQVHSRIKKVPPNASFARRTHSHQARALPNV